MTPDFRAHTATLFSCTQGSPNLHAFILAVAAWLPWPESINAISRLISGPRAAQEGLAAAFWTRVFIDDQDGAAEILDDLVYRPWTRMPWLADEFI